MKWLQSWLRTTADSFGPRCTDGTLLREMPFTSKHCDEKESNNIEENIPGCESESVSVGNGEKSVKTHHYSLIANLQT